jgi:hypothetical protein
MLPVAMGLIGCWVVMGAPWLLGRVTIPWDAKAHFLPQVQFLAQSIARGESPFWSPFVFAGHPQVADPQSMIFSPPFLLLALVNGNPSPWAFDVVVLLMQLAGAFALVLWMRDREWHWAGALMAGIVFAFGAAMAWRIQHVGQVLSLCYWPMAMVCVDRSFRLQSYRYGIAAGLFAAFMILGRDQVALLATYLLAIYVLWRWLGADAPMEEARRMAGPVVAGGVVTAALVVLPILMTAMLAADSNRPVIDLEGAGRGSLHPALLLTFLFPQLFGAAYRMEDYWGPPSFAWNDTGLYIAQNMGQLYVGAVPLFLIGLALLQGQLWNREIRFFTIAYGVMLLYALGWYTPVFRLIYEVVPGVKLYRRPADAVFLIGGLAAVLAGYVVHRIFTSPWERISENAIAILAGSVSVALITALGLGFWLDRVGMLAGPMTIAAVCLAAAAAAIAFAKPRIPLEPWPMALVLAGVTAADLAYNNGPSSSSALPPRTYEAMHPATRNATVLALKSRVHEGLEKDATRARRDRVELLGLGFHWPNVSLSHGLEQTLGYNPVRLRLYSEATGAEDHVGLPDQRKLSPLLASYKSPLVDMLGLRYIAAGAPLESIDKSIRSGDFALVAKTEEAWIYENPRALPRVVFANRAIGADFDELMRTGRWPAFDPRTTVLLEGSGQVMFASMGAVDPKPPSVRIVRYRNTEVVVETDSQKGGWVVLHDPWQRWWGADVDGAGVPVLRANVLFRAVEVTPGKHTVRFRFHPISGAIRQWMGRS